MDRCSCHDACSGYYGGADCNAATATDLDALAGADPFAAADAGTAEGDARACAAYVASADAYRNCCGDPGDCDLARCPRSNRKA